MSTVQEKPPERRFAIDLHAASPDPKDETIAALEIEIQGMRNKHYEERFVWALVCIGLADTFIFTHMQNWAGALVIGGIELIAVAVLAARYEVDVVAPLIDKLIGFTRKANKVED